MHTLNKILADLYVLTTKTKNFHWNVKGSRFSMLHNLFQEHYEAMDGFIDEVAEQIVIMGARPEGTLKGYLRLSDIEESEEVLNETGMISELAKDHEHMISALTEFVKNPNTDPGTEDLLNDILKFHQKSHWMLSAHLKE